MALSGWAGAVIGTAPSAFFGLFAHHDEWPK